MPNDPSSLSDLHQLMQPYRSESGVVVAEARRFPSDISNQLLGVDYRVLDWLTFLSKQQRKKTGASYCFPGRAWLAGKIGCSIRTVSRSIARLKRLGILDVTQRRPVRGQWRSNLYKIRSWVGWRLGQVSGMLRKIGHRGPFVAHIASVRTEIISSQGPPLAKTDTQLSPNGTGAQILERWKVKGLC